MSTMPWISVKDKWPDPFTEVLVINKAGKKYIGWHCTIAKQFKTKVRHRNLKWRTRDVLLENVTHWMIIPELI